MALYQLASGGGVIRTSDGAFIPDDPGNADRQRYAAWLEAGGTPDETPPPTPVPVVVSRLRFKLALLNAGKLADVETAVANAGGVAPLYWAESTTFESSHPLVAEIGAAIGLSAEQIAAIFEDARDMDA